MRDNLHGPTQVFAVALTLQYFGIDFTSREVTVLVQVDIDKPFVVTQIQVCFGTVIGYEHFTVLVRVHRTGIDVQIRVKLLNGNFETATLQQAAK